MAGNGGSTIASNGFLDPWEYVALWPLDAPAVHQRDQDRGLRAYPNPLVEQTRLDLSLDEPTWVQGVVFDVSGRLVAIVHDGWASGPSVSFRWDAKDQTGKRCRPGLYVVRVRFRSTESQLKIVLMNP